MACLDHAVRDGRVTRSGEPRVISRRMQFVETSEDGSFQSTGPAPYLDYRPATGDEYDKLEAALKAEWLRNDLEGRCVSYAIQNLAREHLDEVRNRALDRIDKTERAVRNRL